VIDKQDFIHRALSQGADDVRFADAQGTLAFREGDGVNIVSRLPGATCIVVLFASFLPAKQGAPQGFMPASAYYPASNRAYHATKTLCKLLRENGASALQDTELPARAAALRTGGFIGDNGFYYHDQFGSYVAIQTILTDAFAPDEPALAQNRCTHCGSCAAVCPSNATQQLSRCLRKHINHEVPEALRRDIYQILGCEKCQSACPLNPPGQSEARVFPLETLLSGAATEELRGLAGSNFVRRRRLQSQAALYAAATGYKQVLPQLLELSQTADEPVRSHARWAYEMLKEDTP
jgi:epoxyqueuosine reductase QueG